MSKPATKPVPITAATKTRKPRASSMSVKDRFDLQRFVVDASPTDPDATVAKLATAKFGRPILTATVSEYRKAFGLATVARPSYAQLEAYIEVLKDAVECLSSPADVPAMPVASTKDEAPAP